MKEVKVLENIVYIEGVGMKVGEWKEEYWNHILDDDEYFSSYDFWPRWPSEYKESQKGEVLFVSLPIGRFWNPVFWIFKNRDRYDHAMYAEWQITSKMIRCLENFARLNGEELKESIDYWLIEKLPLLCSSLLKEDRYFLPVVLLRLPPTRHKYPDKYPNVKYIAYGRKARDIYKRILEKIGDLAFEDFFKGGGG